MNKFKQSGSGIQSYGNNHNSSIYNHSNGNDNNIYGDNNIFYGVITISNIFINLPTHLFQNIKIFDMRSIDEILFTFFEFTYNLLILPYIMIRYGYDPPIYFS